MAIEAGAGLRSRIVERALGGGLHARLWRLGMAVMAGLLRGLPRLFGLGGVVARLALVGRPLLVQLVLELHAAHRGALEDVTILGFDLAVRLRGQPQNEEQTTDTSECEKQGLLGQGLDHVSSAMMVLNFVMRRRHRHAANQASSARRF